MKDLIGKKVKGFKFEDTNKCKLNNGMVKYIGEVGEIVECCEKYNNYKIQFADDHWWYPADQIEAHLVDEWVVGEEYEFSDEGTSERKRGILLHVMPERFSSRFLAQYINNEYSWYAYDNIHPIKDPIQKQIEKLEKELAELKQLTSNK
jgi:hypothetical protein